MFCFLSNLLYLFLLCGLVINLSLGLEANLLGATTVLFPHDPMTVLPILHAEKMMAEVFSFVFLIHLMCIPLCETHVWCTLCTHIKCPECSFIVVIGGLHECPIVFFGCQKGDRSFRCVSRCESPSCLKCPPEKCNQSPLNVR